MYYLGTTFLGADFALSPPATSVNNCDKIYLYGMYCDDLLISGNTNAVLSPTDEWVPDTIFHAKFNNTLDAGNVDFNLTNTSHLCIKRRKKDTFKWTTLDVKEIRTIDDFKLYGIDYTNCGKTTYQYAVVPMLNGVEGNYNTIDVRSEMDGIYIVGNKKIFGTIIDPGKCDTTTDTNIKTIDLINQEYPICARYGKKKSKRGTASGTFVEITQNCELDIDNGSTYREVIINELSNGTAKILKHYDGRMWLISVVGEITDSASDVYQLRTITFDWAEIGNCDSMKDLSKFGLIDVPEEWW